MFETIKTNLRKFPLFIQVEVVEGFFLKRKLRDFHRTIGGHIFFQTLCSAVQMDLFSYLSERKFASKMEIMQKLHIEDQPCRILLLGLSNLGLVHKNGDRYKNSFMAHIYLNRHSKKNIINVILWQHFVNYQAMYHFHASLKSNKNEGLIEIPGSGETLYERLKSHPSLETIFQNAMQDISTQANQIFAKHVNLSNVRTLVDVGGGNGSNILQLVDRYPQLTASVFDSLSVCQIAAKKLALSPHAKRLGTIVGNCFTDTFPSVDCILFCHFFTIWSKEENLRLLKKSYKALPVGGQVMIFNMMQNNSEDGPATAAMGSPYFLTLATGRGMLYTWNEYVELFEEAGFQKIQMSKLPMNHGIVRGHKL